MSLIIGAVILMISGIAISIYLLWFEDSFPEIEISESVEYFINCEHIDPYGLTEPGYVRFSRKVPAPSRNVVPALEEPELPEIGFEFIRGENLSPQYKESISPQEQVFSF